MKFWYTIYCLREQLICYPIQASVGMIWVQSTLEPDQIRAFEYGPWYAVFSG